MTMLLLFLLQTAALGVPWTGGFSGQGRTLFYKPCGSGWHVWLALRRCLSCDAVWSV